MDADETQFPITKSPGTTESERYLAELCEKNFVSFWSYPRPFRNQGGNKELCDLLVVMGDDVIIFSDKHCELEPKSTLERDWARWFRSAVQGGARQAWGAERWLRQQPGRVFLDPECTRPLPVPLPDPGTARYHLVVTMHGVSVACQAMLGGTGSLMIGTDVRGFAAHQRPFLIGDLDPKRAFVHVLDDATLDLVMSTVDTTTDVLRYLREKERLCRSQTTFYVAGEENLLAYYLTHLDENGDHAFVFDSDADLITIDESWWADFESSEERRAQLEGRTEMLLMPRVLDLVYGGPVPPTLIEPVKMDSIDVSLDLLIRYVLAPRFGQSTEEIALLTRPPTKVLVAVDPEKRFETPEMQESERVKLVDRLFEFVPRELRTPAARAEIDTLVKVTTWGKYPWEFANFTDRELATALVSRGRPPRGLDFETLVGLIHAERLQPPDPKDGGPNIEKVCLGWPRAVRKVPLAEELWPVLERKIKRSLSTGNYRVPAGQVAVEALRMAMSTHRRHVGMRIR